MNGKFKIVLAIAALLAVGQLLAQNALTLEAQFKIAERKAEIEGDQKGAIELFKKITDAKGVDRALAAKAFLAIGDSYHKLRNDAEAKKVYEQAARLYSGEAGATATQRLAALSGGAPVSGILTRSLICQDCERASSISDDGRFMALNNPLRGITMRDMATGKVTPFGPASTIPEGVFTLDASIATTLYPVFSKNGDYVAYTRDSVFSQPRSSAIEVMPNEPGGKPRTLISFQKDGIRPVAWTPDGQSILITVWDFEQKTFRFEWLAVSDGKRTPIKFLGWRLGSSSVATLSLSPDGRWIAYSALPGNPDSPDALTTAQERHIYVLPADGKGPEVAVAKGANLNLSPVWMPDGKTILFISNRNGDFGLWSVVVQDGKAGEPVLVEPNLGNVSVLGTTRSGAYYYMGSGGTVPQIVVTELQPNSGQPPSNAARSVAGTSPSWSPDGARIAFQRQTRLGGSPLVPDLLLVFSVDTGEETRYDPPDSTLKPSGKAFWFHNGKGLLLLMSDAGGKDSLYQVDLKTKAFKQVLPVVRSLPVAISPDDKTIYVIEPGEAVAVQTSTPAVNPLAGLLPAGFVAPTLKTRTDRVLAIDLGKAEQRPVTAVPAPRDILLSPDAQTLYMTACDTILTSDGPGVFSTPCRRIVAVDVKTGRLNPVLTVAEPEGISGRFALSGDGRWLAVIVQRNGENRLIGIMVDGTGAHDIYKSKDAILTPSWSRDGKTVTVKTPVKTEQDTGKLSIPIQMLAGLGLGAEIQDLQVIRIPANGGGVEVLGPVAPGELSPDGARVARSVSLSGSSSVYAIENLSAFLKNKNAR